MMAIKSPQDAKTPRFTGRSELRKCLIILAERVGFEPTVPCGTPDFESVTRSLRSPGYQLAAQRATRRERSLRTLLGRNPPTAWHTW